MSRLGTTILNSGDLQNTAIKGSGAVGPREFDSSRLICAVCIMRVMALCCNSRSALQILQGIFVAQAMRAVTIDTPVAAG
jgi:hypothetical protein